MKMIKNFVQLFTFRFVARVLMALRGFLIVASLSPKQLGDYAILFLYVFYFSMLDFGSEFGLERDLPHYSASESKEKCEGIARIGWSTYFILSFIASILLWFALTVFYRHELNWLSIFVALYLLFDQVLRAHISNARIQLKYRDLGIAEVIDALASLCFVMVLLPRFGIQGVFVALVVSLFFAICYLNRVVPIRFLWQFNLKHTFRFIRSSIGLSLITYLSRLFHYLPLTILAFVWSRETLGHFVFAFRVFEILLALFPYLTQELVRTLMYQRLAQLEKGKNRFKILMMPIGFYLALTLCLWFVIYWFSLPIAHWLFPAYVDSIPALQILSLSLIPFGISQIIGDFLSSRVLLKTRRVVSLWVVSTVVQCVLFIIMMLSSYRSPVAASAVYGIGSVFVFILSIFLASQVLMEQK